MNAELRHPQDYFRWAETLKEDTTLAETAKGVCTIRGIDPHSYGADGLYAWKAVAMEALLMAAIARNAP